MAAVSVFLEINMICIIIMLLILETFANFACELAFMLQAQNKHFYDYD